MGMFSSVVGGMVGAELLHVAQGVLDRNGGIAGVVGQFEQKGFGDTVKSWVGTGPNLPITPDQVHQVLGSDAVTQLAAKAGISSQELLQKLSQALPQVIDKLTPGGVVPKS